MIRYAKLSDAKAIADIYNEYILHSVATFETEAVSEDEMYRRLFPVSLFGVRRGRTGHRICLCPFVAGKGCLLPYVGNNRLRLFFVCPPGHRTTTDVTAD